MVEKPEDEFLTAEFARLYPDYPYEMIWADKNYPGKARF